MGKKKELSKYFVGNSPFFPLDFGSKCIFHACRKNIHPWQELTSPSPVVLNMYNVTLPHTHQQHITGQCHENQNLMKIAPLLEKFMRAIIKVIWTRSQSAWIQISREQHRSTENVPKGNTLLNKKYKIQISYCD